MRFRVKSDRGTKVISLSEEDGTTVEALIKEVISQGLVDQGVELTIKSGFPPKDIVYKSKKDKLIDIGVRSGDQLIFSQVEQTPKSKQTIRSDIPSVYNEALDIYAILRNVPDDNSCMFNSIVYALFGVQEHAVEEVHKLRQVVATTISADKGNKYTELVLGRPITKYCQWILNMDSWGGAIELGILAEHFQIAIHCLDVESGKIMKFQSEQHKPHNFIVLVYSGIHYDLVVRNQKLSTTKSDKQSDVCVFENGSLEGDTMLQDCEKLGQLLQTQNYSTNTTTFRLRCLQCYEVLVGEMGASNHANSTGHFKFGETT
ncbi:ubiquitin thioesterase Otu1p [[Candida] anglica]|uniref:Ubiquitin thioesterase OTU n=1 Tax=[Candida] anglica TaxID=148631 RepID=A0ABP0EJA5_9ASCO